MCVLILLVTSKPTIKDLHRYVIPRYASVWRKIGKELGLPNETLAIIEKDHSATGVEKCCHGILSKWLEVNTDASWQKLFAVTDKCASKYFIICILLVIYPSPINLAQNRPITGYMYVHL